MKKIKKLLIKNWSIIALLILYIFISLPFFSKKLVAGHDIEVHGVRLANYYLALKQDQFPPQWAPNMNYGFGYPVFIYSYHLPYALGLLPFVITKSVEQSLNFVFILSIFSAGFGSYYLAKVHKKSQAISFLSSLVFVLSPYFLLTIYIRGAVAEALFLGLMPFVFALITKPNINKLYEKLLLFFVMSALLLSHHIAFLVFLPLLSLWFILNWKISSKKDFKVIIEKIKITFFSILATSFYWIPAFLGSNLIDVSGSSLTAFDPGFLKISQLWWGLWDCQPYCYATIQRPLPTFLGFISLSLLILAVIALIYKKIHKDDVIKTIFWLGISLISIFLMFPISFYFWNTLPIIGMIEFPWLLLWVPTIASVFCLIYLEKYIFKKGFLVILLLAIIVAQSSFALFFWKTPERKLSKLNEDWFEFGDITQNYDGLLPKKFDSHKNLKLDENIVIRLDGSKTFDTINQKEPNNQGEIEILEWTGTEMKYMVTASGSAKVIQKTVDFPGWNAKIDGKNAEIIATDNEFPGRITIPISQGKHLIETTYRSDTFSQILGKSASLLGILGMFGYVFFIYKKRKN